MTCNSHTALGYSDSGNDDAAAAAAADDDNPKLFLERHLVTLVPDHPVRGALRYRVTCNSLHGVRM